MAIHVAIMRPKWGLLSKILSGQKTIETRWYRSRRAPWNKIKMGDTIYFKDAGKPITVVAKVARVDQYEDLTNEKTLEILNSVALQDLGIEVPYFASNKPVFKDIATLLPSEIKNYIFGKKYATVVWLKNARPVEKPFYIDKTGFGAMASWLVFEDEETFNQSIVKV